MGKCFVIAAIGFATMGRVCLADSIVVDGQRYDNVYIGSGSSMYYIQDPRTGSMTNVRKSKVRPEDVEFTKDRIERRKLWHSWKTKREAMDSSVARTISLDDWRATLRDGIPETNRPQAAIVDSRTVSKNGILGKTNGAGIMQLTNTPDKLAKRGDGRKMFVNSQGTGIITNRPDMFRGNSEYIEVVLHYETIEIPEKFQAKGGRRHIPDVETFDDIVGYYAGRYKLEKSLVYAVIQAESAGNPYAVSPAGARGLMQLMPGTAREMGVNDIFDPAENIAGGTQYLSKLRTLYTGNVTLTLAAYNAGPGNVKRYGGVPPFRETRDYIRRVQAYQRNYERNGPPRFELANARPVENDYLPSQTNRYYRIVLDNGLTVPAEDVVDDGEYYGYVFEGRSGHIRKDQVAVIYNPS